MMTDFIILYVVDLSELTFWNIPNFNILDDSALSLMASKQL